MVKALFDTNILVGYLRGVPQARDELALYDDIDDQRHHVDGSSCWDFLDIGRSHAALP